MIDRRANKFEWPTVVLVICVYIGFAFGTTWLYTFWPPLGIALVILTMTLHSSLTHEILHGHPFRNQFLNAALVFPSLSFLIPYLRFSDLHLAHHYDENLTDPYDDPETNFIDPKSWHRFPEMLRYLFRFNNTLIGRMLIGPLLGQISFMFSDMVRISKGELRVALGWAIHVFAMASVLYWIVYIADISFFEFLISAYCAMALLKVRTFLEHRAHEKPRARTVVIEGQGVWSFLFLNNNFHVVHHMHPNVSWYKLPSLYQENREHYLRRNQGYYFAGYASIFRHYLFKAKDPVPHPLKLRK